MAPTTQVDMGVIPGALASKLLAEVCPSGWPTPNGCPLSPGCTETAVVNTVSKTMGLLQKVVHKVQVEHAWRARILQGPSNLIVHAPTQVLNGESCEVISGTANELLPLVEPWNPCRVLFGSEHRESYSRVCVAWWGCMQILDLFELAPCLQWSDCLPIKGAAFRLVDQAHLQATAPQLLAQIARTAKELHTKLGPIADHVQRKLRFCWRWCTLLNKVITIITIITTTFQVLRVWESSHMPRRNGCQSRRTWPWKMWPILIIYKWRRHIFIRIWKISNPFYTPDVFIIRITECSDSPTHGAEHGADQESVPAKCLFDNRWGSCGPSAKMATDGFCEHESIIQAWAVVSSHATITLKQIWETLKYHDNFILWKCDIFLTHQT